MASLSSPNLLSEGLDAALDLVASSCRMHSKASHPSNSRPTASKTICLLATRLARRLIGMPHLAARSYSRLARSPESAWSVSSWICDVTCAVECVKAVPGNFELHDALIRSVLDLHAAGELYSAAQRIELSKVFCAKVRTEGGSPASKSQS